MEPSEAADHNLLRSLCDRIRNGDEAALADLYDQAAGPLFGFAKSILNDNSDAEEVVEDVFIKAWRGADGYDPDRGSVMSWLWTMCRSRALDRVRARTRRQQVMDAAANDLAEPAIEALDGIVDGRALAPALDRLPLVQRQVLTLAYFRGYTHREISEALGLSLGTVKTHIRRTLERLRGELAP